MRKGLASIRLNSSASQARLTDIARLGGMRVVVIDQGQEKDVIFVSDTVHSGNVVNLNATDYVGIADALAPDDDNRAVQISLADFRAVLMLLPDASEETAPLLSRLLDKLSEAELPIS